MTEFIGSLSASNDSQADLQGLFSTAAGMAGFVGDKAGAIVEIMVDGVMEARERRDEIIY